MSAGARRRILTSSPPHRPNRPGHLWCGRHYEDFTSEVKKTKRTVAFGHMPVFTCDMAPFTIQPAWSGGRHVRRVGTLLLVEIRGGAFSDEASVAHKPDCVRSAGVRSCDGAHCSREPSLVAGLIGNARLKTNAPDSVF